MNILNEPIKIIDRESLERKWDWVGLVVRTRRVLQNGLGTIPEGSFALVKGQHNGADLVFKPCDDCGVQFNINKVDLGSLEPVVRIVKNPPYRNSLYYRQNPEAIWGKFEEWAVSTYGPYPDLPPPYRQAAFEEQIRYLIDGRILSMEDMLSVFEQVARSIQGKARSSLDRAEECS